MPLPFLRLPELIQTEVLLKLNQIDLIYVSSISSKSRAIVKRSRKVIDLLRWNFGSVSDYDLELDRWGGCGLNFRIDPRVENVSSIRINGEVVPIHRSGDNCLNIGGSDLSEDEQQKLMELLSDLIFDIFKVKDCHLAVYNFEHKEFVSRYTKKLKTLQIEDENLPPDFQNVLEEFSVEELIMYCFLHGEQQPAKFNVPLKMKVLECLTFECLSEEALASLECPKVLLDTEEFNENDIKRGLREWKTGGLKHLEEFVVQWDSPTLEDLTRVLEEFQAEQIGEVEFRIQREDETTANIALNTRGFKMTIEK